KRSIASNTSSGLGLGIAFSASVFLFFVFDAFFFFLCFGSDFGNSLIGDGALDVSFIFSILSEGIKEEHASSISSIISGHVRSGCSFISFTSASSCSKQRPELLLNVCSQHVTRLNPNFLINSCLCS